VCTDCSSIKNVQKKHTRLCDKCVQERRRSAEIVVSSAQIKEEPSLLHRKQYAVSAKHRSHVLRDVLKSRKNVSFPKAGVVHTLASDGSHLNVRESGYSKTGKKSPSKPALYQLIGAKLLKSNKTYGKKLLNVSQKSDLFKAMLTEWTQTLQSGGSTDVLMERCLAATTTTNTTFTGQDDDIIEHKDQESADDISDSPSKMGQVLSQTEEYAKADRERRRLEDENWKLNHGSDKKIEPVKSLPKFLLWNVILPSKPPDLGYFRGLFGADVASDDFGENLVMLFRLTEGTTPSSSNAATLFSRFVRVCETNKSSHPLRKRFKLIAKMMKNTFEKDAGLGGLSSFNGKPKILRDTVKCTFFVFCSRAKCVFFSLSVSLSVFVRLVCFSHTSF